jgi:multidrug resistance efflux pump
MKDAFLYSPRNSAISLYILAVIVAVAVGWAYLTHIDISVHARGIVRPEGEPIRIISEAGGRIHRIHVKEGDQVHAGDPLVQLDTQNLTLKQRSLETRINFTELRLADLQRQVDDAAAVEERSASADSFDHEAAQFSARVNLENARVRFARMDLLFREGLVPRQTYDESRMALSQAEADSARLSSKSLELKRAQAAVRVRDLAAQMTPLRADLAALYHELEQTRLDIDRLTVTAPNDGQLTSFAPLHADEILSPGATLGAVVSGSNSLVIECWLPSTDRSYVSVGNSVRLRSESLAHDGYDAFDGTISSISPDARFNDALNGAYRVLITPGSFAPELKLGMTFEVNFITKQDRLLLLLFEKIRIGFR